MNPVSTRGGTMVATEGEILDVSTPKGTENTFSGILRTSAYFAKPKMNHCKNRPLTWI